jgi:hypothetical protein
MNECGWPRENIRTLSVIFRDIDACIADEPRFNSSEILEFPRNHPLRSACCAVLHVEHCHILACRAKAAHCGKLFG